MSAQNDTAWTYLVVSSEQQADTLDAQESWAHETARKNRWAITREFRDVSSGKAGVRRLLSDLIAALLSTPKSQRPARVLLTRIDRLGRGDPLEAMSAVNEIKKLGVALHTREEGGDVPLKTAMDALFPMLRSVMAGIENEIRSDRVRAGHARRKAAGKHHGHPPYGATLKDGKVVPHETEALLTRKIFELRLQGWGYDRLAEYAADHAEPKLLRDGVTTRRLRWGRSTIDRLLRCASLRGTVVEEAIYDRVQEVRGETFVAARKQTWPYALAGALRCTCGMMLAGQASGRPTSRERYYVCRAKQRHGYYPHTRATAAETAFGDLLTRLTANPELLEPPADHADADALRARLRSAQAELRSVESRRERVWALFEAGGMDDEVRDRLAEIKADRESAERRLAEAERELAAVQRQGAGRLAMRESLATMAAQWTDGSLETRQEIARAVAEVVGGLFVAPKRNPNGRRRLGTPPEPVEIFLGKDRTRS